MPRYPLSHSLTSRRNTSSFEFISSLYVALFLLMDSIISFLQPFLSRPRPQPRAQFYPPTNAYANFLHLRAEVAAITSSTCDTPEVPESTSIDESRSSTTTSTKTMTMASSGCTLPPNNFHIFQCHVCLYRTSDRYLPLNPAPETLSCVNCAHVLSTCLACEAQSTSYVPYKECWACGDLNGLGGLYAGYGVEGDRGRCQTCREELLDNSDLRWTWAKGRHQGRVDVDEIERDVGNWNRKVKRGKEPATGGWGWRR